MKIYTINIKEDRKKQDIEFYKCSEVKKELSELFQILDRELPPSLKKKVNQKLKKQGILK